MQDDALEELGRGQDLLAFGLFVDAIPGTAKSLKPLLFLSLDHLSVYETRHPNGMLSYLVEVGLDRREPVALLRL